MVFARISSPCNCPACDVSQNRSEMAGTHWLNGRLVVSAKRACDCKKAGTHWRNVGAKEIPLPSVSLDVSDEDLRHACRYQFAECDWNVVRNMQRRIFDAEQFCCLSPRICTDSSSPPSYDKSQQLSLRSTQPGSGMREAQASHWSVGVHRGHVTFRRPSCLRVCNKPSPV